MEDDKDVFVTSGMVKAEFNFWVGISMDRFYDHLKDKKFIGTKCSKCNRVMVPPRNRCGKCFAKAEEFVELAETGTLKNFTFTHYKINERRIRPLKDPLTVGLVQLDGADTSMAFPILNAKPDNITEDLRVKAVWGEITKGLPEDIKGFEPIGGE